MRLYHAALVFLSYTRLSYSFAPACLSGAKLNCLASSQYARHSSSALCMTADDDNKFTAEQWEARKKLAGILQGEGLDRIKEVHDPESSPLSTPDRTWDEDMTELNDLNLSRKLAAATAASKGTERKALNKIVSRYFEEGAEEFMQSAERIIADNLVGWEEAAEERSQATQGALLSDIDKLISDFKASRKDMSALLSDPLHKSKSETLAAELEALLEGTASADDTTNGASSSSGSSSSRDSGVAAPDTILDQGPATELQKGTVLREHNGVLYYRCLLHVVLKNSGTTHIEMPQLLRN
eukprot:13850-Heterococcus_DN1.PRE.1